MAAPARDDNPLDGGAAYPTRLALSPVYTMAQLEESLLAVRIDVIVNRRSAQLNGFAQDPLAVRHAAFATRRG